MGTDNQEIINQLLKNFHSRIYLRALEPEDFRISCSWRNDDELNSMIGGHKYYVSTEIEKEWVNKTIHSQDKLVCAICLRENDKYIGNVMLREIDWINRTGRIPIMLGDKEEQGKGYATEARMLMHRFAFYERNLHRIWALVLEDNIPSLKLHEKCGYKREGLMRESVFKDGKYHNQVVMSVFRPEFEEAFISYLKAHQKTK